MTTNPAVAGPVRAAPTAEPMETPVFRIRAALGSLVLFVATAAQAADPLTVAQVESVTGLTGLKMQPSKVDRTARTFTTATDELALTMKLAHASVFEFWREQPSADDQAPVKGLGDEAFASAKGRYVCFRKASKGVCLIARAATGNAAQLVTETHLMTLAKMTADGL